MEGTANIGLSELMNGEVYGGSEFSVAHIGDAWVIYYFSGDELPMPGDAEFGAHEKIVLDQAGMDDLRDYFANHYAEDRAEVAATREP